MSKVRPHGAGDEGTLMTVVTVAHIPLRTRIGTIWAIPVKPPSAARIQAERNRNRARYRLHYTVCDFCAREGRCREAVAAGDFIGCEWPLERELLEVDDGKGE
jgi:hypothetical protein